MRKKIVTRLYRGCTPQRKFEIQCILSIAAYLLIAISFFFIIYVLIIPHDFIFKDFNIHTEQTM